MSEHGHAPDDGAAPDDRGTAPDGGTPGKAAADPEWRVPWPEGAQASSWSPERAQLGMAFAAAIRKTGSLMHLMSQAAADKIGINATDLNCLNILSFSGQLTAGELARATGLSTASITGVVDRLAEAEFVTRERDAADRRRVVIRLNTPRALGAVGPVFGPMMGAWQRMAGQYSDDELRLIVEFYDQMEQVLRDHLARLREQPGPADARPGNGQNPTGGRL
jgi:DNA-binding transcriptional ArsR family regulator